VYAGKDNLTAADVAVKFSRHADLEVRHLLLAAACDPHKVVALAMRRPVTPGEILGRDGGPEMRRPAMRAVVTELHRPAPALPPACRTDAEARAAMLPYFEAVAELHASSSLEAHGDVKFANFVRPAGDAAGRCLVDLETALPRGGPGQTWGPSRGTPAFMAPERMVWGDVGAGADPWALGIMLFQACHPGRIHPFFAAGEPIASAALHKAMAETAYSPAMWDNAAAPLSADLARSLLSSPLLRPSPQEALRHALFRAPGAPGAPGAPAAPGAPGDFFMGASGQNARRPAERPPAAARGQDPGQGEAKGVRRRAR
jgi:hypothetical protein